MKRHVAHIFWLLAALAMLAWPLALFAESDGSLTGVVSFSRSMASPGPIGSGTPSTGYFTLATVYNGTPSQLPTVQSGTLLEVAGQDGTTPRISLDGFGTGVNTSITMRAARNTAAVPQALGLDDIIGRLNVFGRGATVYSAGQRGALSFGASEGWTDAAQGVYIDFVTTNTGTVTSNAKMRLSAAGNLLVGGTVDTGITGTGGLHVSNATDASAIGTAANILDGGLSVAKALLVGSATDSTTTATGSIITSGGIGIAKGCVIGGKTSHLGATAIHRVTFADANYNALATDTMISTSAAFTAPRVLNLVAGATLGAGTIIAVCDEAGAVGAVNTLTLTANGAETIRTTTGTATTLVKNTAGSVVLLLCTGSTAPAYIVLSNL